MTGGKYLQVFARNKHSQRRAAAVNERGNYSQYDSHLFITLKVLKARLLGRSIKTKLFKVRRPNESE